MSRWLALLSLALGVLTFAAAVTHAVRARRWSLAWAVSMMATTLVAVVLLSVLDLSRAEQSSKATMIAREIAEAMNCSAFVILPGVASLVPFVIGEVRRRDRK
jgi:hypothetical protein